MLGSTSSYAMQLSACISQAQQHTNKLLCYWIKPNLLRGILLPPILVLKLTKLKKSWWSWQSYCFALLRNNCIFLKTKFSSTNSYSNLGGKLAFSLKGFAKQIQAVFVHESFSVSNANPTSKTFCGHILRDSRILCPCQLVITPTYSVYLKTLRRHKRRD